MQALRPDQLEAAAQTLAASFWDDPLMTHVVAPDEKKRAAIGPWFFATEARYALRWADIRASDDVSAVGIWLAPGNQISPFRMLRVGFGALPFKAGLGATRRMMTAISTSEKFHHEVKGPHWYLWTLGTNPSAQGTGLGGALVEYGTSQADAAGIPCYLETASESNIAFYSKRGFEVTNQADILGFTIYGMVRQPGQR